MAIVSRLSVILIVINGLALPLDAQRIRIANAGVIPNGGMTAPTILKSTFVPYTDEARARAIAGTVTLETHVDATGRITVLRVTRGLGSGLDEVAATAVAEWSISPATRNGVPVSVVAEVDVDFSLRTANAFRMGPGMTPPTVIHRVEPQYTTEARAAGYTGTVVLEAVLKKDGGIDIIRVVRGLGLGLTDGAVSALKQWQFRPGAKDGQDVDVIVNIEVNFNLRR
jgi:TonB family protein